MNTIHKTIKKLLPFGKVGLGSLLCLILLSCRTVYVDKPVTVERIKHDTITVNNSTRDSVFLKDSIYIHAIGDTIYRDRWHTKYIEKRVRYDSIVVQRDTIPVVVETRTVELKKYTPLYMKVLAMIGVIATVLTIILVWHKYKGDW